jgi:hypothetical protein
MGIASDKGLHNNALFRPLGATSDHRVAFDSCMLVDRLNKVIE